MSLSSFVFTEDNHFVAVERHSIFRTSVYLVLLDKGYLIGLELNKRLVLGEVPSLLKKISFCNTVSEVSNPYAYLNEGLVNEVVNKYLYDASIFGVSKYNFRIHIDSITAIDYLPFASSVNSLSSFLHSGSLNIRTTHGDCNLLNNRPVNKSFRGRGSLQNDYNRSINIGYKQLKVISNKPLAFLQFFSNKQLLHPTFQSSTNYLIMN